ncbi:hypothetical protein AB0J21_16090 [Streptomyces sp. NPDC049954]|uniref:hypothetical protein n=1 Tax=Streptomyces sp. NPDC049954 TaxID=3155779 RepID=UPI00342C3061
MRNLERDGVLPPAGRTAAGYRVYGEIHVWSALAYRALAVATGPVEAKRMVRAVHESPVTEVLALLDAAHARLDRNARTSRSPGRPWRRSPSSRSRTYALRTR